MGYDQRATNTDPMKATVVSARLGRRSRLFRAAVAQVARVVRDDSQAQIELPAGGTAILDQTPADNEYQLQELLKREPGLLPLDELGIPGPIVVVGRESALDSGNVDLVLLGNGGDLALVEFKTGPQNPDFRECLAQLLDYGSDSGG